MVVGRSQELRLAVDPDADFRNIFNNTQEGNKKVNHFKCGHILSFLIAVVLILSQSLYCFAGENKNAQSHPKDRITPVIDSISTAIINRYTPDADPECRKIQKIAVRMVLDPRQEKAEQAFRDLDAAIKESFGSSSAESIERAVSTAGQIRSEGSYRVWVPQLTDEDRLLIQQYEEEGAKASARYYELCAHALVCVRSRQSVKADEYLKKAEKEASRLGTWAFIHIEYIRTLNKDNDIWD